MKGPPCSYTTSVVSSRVVGYDVQSKLALLGQDSRATESGNGQNLRWIAMKKANNSGASDARRVALRGLGHPDARGGTGGRGSSLLTWRSATC